MASVLSNVWFEQLVAHLMNCDVRRRFDIKFVTVSPVPPHLIRLDDALQVVVNFLTRLAEAAKEIFWHHSHGCCAARHSPDTQVSKLDYGCLS